MLNNLITPVGKKLTGAFLYSFLDVLLGRINSLLTAVELVLCLLSKHLMTKNRNKKTVYYNKPKIIKWICMI